MLAAGRFGPWAGPVHVPKGTEKFATFMHKVGLLDQKAGSWKDFFFPVMHGAAGD
jgi:hypothetical protein